MNGQIIILNGTPRSGKSSIAREIQAMFDGTWMNIGVDHVMAITPERFMPGIGLRPGGERPDLEPVVATLYRCMYDSIAAYSRRGIDVVTDVGHHDWYSRPLGILPECAEILSGLPTLFVGVRCPIESVMERRRSSGWNPDWNPGDPPPEPVLRWQEAVHRHGVYDLEIDTSVFSPAAAATQIRERIESGPPGTAFSRLANGTAQP